MRCSVLALAVSIAITNLLLPTGYVLGQTAHFRFIDPIVSSATDMSPDGRFIVGGVDQDGDGLQDGTYRYDRVNDDLMILPPLGLGAVAVSDDGSVVLGNIPDPDGIGSNVAAIWTSATGWFSLGSLPNAGACPSRSDGYELSADGSIAVGLSWDGCDGRGFIWSEATGMQELEGLANGNNRASVVSSDGTLVAGFAQGVQNRTPAFWGDSLDGTLLDPPDGFSVGEVHGLRDDGTVMLGEWSGVSDDVLANKWTLVNGNWQREQIGDGSLLPGWIGTPTDIADNDTIVGFDILLTNRRAWIQPDGTGPLITMVQWIQDNGGSIPSGITLEVSQAISTNGKFIIGHGFFSGGWLITFDEGPLVTSDAVTIFRGVQSSGETHDVIESDDVRLNMNPGFVINSDEAPVWLIFDGATAQLEPNSMNIAVESQAGTPGLAATVEAFNWTNQTYEIVGTFDESFNTDSVNTFDVSADAANFIKSGKGNLRARVGWRRTGFTINFPWEVRIDQVAWVFN